MTGSPLGCRVNTDSEVKSSISRRNALARANSGRTENHTAFCSTSSTLLSAYFTRLWVYFNVSDWVTSRISIEAQVRLHMSKDQSSDGSNIFPCSRSCGHLIPAYPSLLFTEYNSSDGALYELWGRVLPSFAHNWFLLETQAGDNSRYYLLTMSTGTDQAYHSLPTTILSG